MSEMVERVAKDIFKYDEHFRTRLGDQWEYAPAWQRNKCLVQARAAIEAMREPTEEMFLAARRAGMESWSEDLWKTMVDEALR